MTRFIKWCFSASRAQRRSFFRGAVVAVVLPGGLCADTYTWDGGSLIDGNWSSVTNWSGDLVAPVSASNTTVKLDGILRVAQAQDIAAPFLLNRLEMLDGPVAGVKPGFNISGSPLRFVADGAIQPVFYFTRNGTGSIHNDIEIAAGTTLSVHFTTYGVHFHGVISGGGGIDKLATDGGIDGLYNGNNSFAGGLTVRAADSNWKKVNVHASGAMGTGSVNLYGGTMNPIYPSPGGLVFFNTTTHTNQFKLFQNSPIFAGEPLKSANVTLNGDVDLNTSAIWLRGGGVGVINGVISEGGADAIHKIDSGKWTLAGANSFTGHVTISGGTLALGAANSLRAQVPVTVSDGIWDLGGFSITNGAVALGSGSIVNGELVGASYAASGSGYVSATLGGAGGLVKSGPGKLTLQGIHTFTGPLAVEQGAVEIMVSPAPGSALWLDAADLKSMAKNGDGSGGVPAPGNTVGYWKSKSGSGWASSSQKPVYQTNVVHGMPALLFNNVTLNLNTNMPAQESTAFIVYRYNNPNGNWKNPLNSSKTLGDHLHMINNKDNRCLTRSGGAIAIDSPSSATSWAVQTVQMHAGDYRLWVNEDEYGPNTSSLNFAPFTAISDVNIVGYYCEILVYTNSLTVAERVNTIRYLRRKWLGEGDLPAINNQLAPEVAAEVKAGALLDLAGGLQTFASLKGSGTLASSTVTVTGLLSPGDAGAAAGTLSINGNLTLAVGATNVFNYVAATSDAVAVSGVLAVQGANTVELLLNGETPPAQIPLFSFGSITGEEFLNTWTIVGDGLAPYSAKIKRVENSLVLTLYPSGTLFMLR
ncbi:MAG: autotransporter-associated beta strand repeat-containing protein [Kiritimatiellae bacterium]|nr:autotransporter-associated beta strand repeat-containing protein [Kiritimatiellia bacterium]